MNLPLQLIALLEQMNKNNQTQMNKNNQAQMEKCMEIVNNCVAKVGKQTISLRLSNSLTSR